jgi:hypothetical protein
MQGGKREGAGRPSLGIKTKTISFRIRVEWEQAIKEVVRKKIAVLKKKTK